MDYFLVKFTTVRALISRENCINPAGGMHIRPITYIPTVLLIIYIEHYTLRGYL